MDPTTVCCPHGLLGLDHSKTTPSANNALKIRVKEVM
jgi:hypothetical protein